jgi:hypothetical protein
MPRERFLLPLFVAVAIGVGGCASNGASVVSSSATLPAATSAATASAATGSAAVTPAATAAPAGAKVSANTASEAEITAALTAAGVVNAARWAKEVVEYRPYDTADPTLQKLQDNLAKYKPDPATLAGILAALAP